jgi:hypothetical protein
LAALGLALLLLAGLPFYATGLPVRTEFPNDRFTLPFIPGSALLISGLLIVATAAIPRKTRVRIILAALLIGLAAGYQYGNSTAYRRDWLAQKAFFWQLTWRAPGLQPGTTLLTNDLPLRFYSDNSLTAPLNWIYAPDNHSQDMDFLLLYPAVRLGESSLPTLEPGGPIRVDYLAAQFSGNTSQALAVYYRPPACLRVIDAEVELGNLFLPLQIRTAAANLSDARRILADPPEPARPMEEYYGIEPTRGWCYYYEKADLARQQRDWGEVGELGDRAFSLGDYPNDPAERFPFIEGYAHLGRWEDALEQTRLSADVSPAMAPVLCRLWSRIAAQTEESGARQAALDQVETSLECIFE